MKSISFRNPLLLVASTLFLGALLLASCKDDDKKSTPSVVHFSGTMSGQAETPPVTNTSGTGTVTATYDPTTKKMEYTFTWSNLSGPAVAMHFHVGAAGVKGPVVIPVTEFPQEASGTASGTAGPLVDSLVTALMNGELYGNIHTTNNPGGEIRAQLVKE